jgi:polysaccharide chain length determinant protein (PEP-CTERM system associated)
MAERELTPKDALAILRRRWLLIALLGIAGAGLGYGICRVLPKQFSSHTLVLVQQPTVNDSYVKPVVSDDNNQRLAAMQQQILSRSRLEPIIKEFGLYLNDSKRVSMEVLVERLRGTITVSPIQPMAQTRSQNLPGFTVSVVAGEPSVAQQICAKITSMFLEENLQLRQDQAEHTTQFLSVQLQEAKGKLDEQDAKLAAFKRRYLGSLPDQEQLNLGLLTGLNSQLEASTQALSRAQQDKSFAESVLTQQLNAWQGSKSGKDPDTLENQLSASQAQLTTLESKYTYDHPDVIKAKNDVEALKQKLADNGHQEKISEADKASKNILEPDGIRQLRAQIYQYEQIIRERTRQQEETQKQIKLYQERVQSSPAVEQEYKELTRDYQTALEFYNELLKKRDESAMATDLERRQQGEQFQVLDPANFPDKPSFPQMQMFLPEGFAGGLALGLGITFLLELFDTSLKCERDVEVALHLPLLVMIPEISGDSGKAKSQISLFGSGGAGPETSA